jgi:hypothetical protein
MIDMDWRQPFIDYIREQKVPSNKNLVEQLIHHTTNLAFRLLRARHD